MSVNFSVLFSQLGAIGGIKASLNTYRGTTIPGKINALTALYSATPSTIDGIYSNLAAYQASPAALLSQLQALFQQTIIAEIDAEAPVTSNSLATALQQLITEMVAGSQSVAAATIGSSVTAGGSNNGAPAVAVGLKTKTGKPLDLVFAETLVGVVTGDFQSGTATRNQESITFTGQVAAPSTLDWTYPLGSASSTTLTAVDASSYNGGGASNYLFNGDWEQTWAGSVPSGWHVTVGAGQITKSVAAGTFFDGLASLKIAGDGSTLTAIQSQFGTDFPGDTPAGILPITQYIANMWIKCDVVPAAGVLEVALVDGSGVVLLDAAGNASSFTKTLSTATTSFVPLNGFLRTPRVLPAAAFLRIRLSTAMSAGSNLFIDRVSLCQPTAAYAQGPYLAVFSGASATPMIVGDTQSVAITNNYANAWQFLFEEACSMRSLGLLLPTSGSPTISAALIA